MAVTPALRATALGSLLLLAACAAPPPVTTNHARDGRQAVRVEYVHPEKFTDVGDREAPGDSLRTEYLNKLSKHLSRKATPLLGTGQQFDVQITEVDMAGGFEPWRIHLTDIRIVRDVYPPRIDLNFRLAAADGRVIREGSRQLRNPAFLLTPPLYFRDDPLRHEKKLLDDWLSHELPVRRD